MGKTRSEQTGGGGGILGKGSVVTTQEFLFLNQLR